MNTKEVIEYFKNYLKATSLIGSPESKQDKVFRRTITLLKRGEKYKKVWEETAFQHLSTGQIEHYVKKYSLGDKESDDA